MKYSSITTPDIEHDEANMLTELIWLNRDLHTEIFPWRGDKGKEWGKTVSAIKKLMKEPFGLSAEQLAFYINKCAPQQINPFEFAKMAVVARKLFKRYNLEEVRNLYVNKRKETKLDGLEKAVYAKSKPKTLFNFLKELESGETKESN